MTVLVALVVGLAVGSYWRATDPVLIERRESWRDVGIRDPDMVVKLVELRLVDNQVQFHWNWTGTYTGPGGNGNAVDLRGYEQWTLDENGLILQSLGQYDETEYQRQLNAGQ